MPEDDDARLTHEAAQGAAQARDEAVEAKADAEEARDELSEARAEAEDARDEAVEAMVGAEAARDESQAGPTLAGTAVPVHELLIHPDDEPDNDSAQPFGELGRPISKHAPFYIGLTGGLGVLTAVALAMALRQISSTLILIIVSMFLAVGLNPLVEWFMHRGLRRPWAVFVVSLGVLSLLSVFVLALVPVLRDQINALVENAPQWLDELNTNRTVQSLDEKYDFIETAKAQLQGADFAQQAFGSVYSVGLAVLNALVNAFLIFVLTLYFLAALPSLKRACYSLAPAARRERVTYLGDEILRQVGGYVSGVFVVATCAGVSSFIFLEIVGLGEYAVALALVVAIVDFIPLIGATIGAVVVVIIGFANSPGIGLACLIFFVIYQQFENYVIYPRVMRSSLNVPGVVTVVAVLIGGGLLGVVGAMIAIPMAAAGLLLVREIHLRKQNGDEGSSPASQELSG